MKNKYSTFYWSCVLISAILLVLKIKNVIAVSYWYCLSPVLLNICFLGITMLVMAIGLGKENKKDGE